MKDTNKTFDLVKQFKAFFKPEKSSDKNFNNNNNNGIRPNFEPSWMYRNE